MVFYTYIGQVKGPIGVEDDWEDGEDKFQDSELEGAEFEQEQSASVGVGGEETNLTDATTKQKNVNLKHNLNPNLEILITVI